MLFRSILWRSGFRIARSTTKCTNFIHYKNLHSSKLSMMYTGFRKCIIESTRSRTSGMSRMGLNNKHHETFTCHSQQQFEFISVSFENAKYRQCVIETSRWIRTSRRSRMDLGKKHHEVRKCHSLKRFEFDLISFELRWLQRMRMRPMSRTS